MKKSFISFALIFCTLFALQTVYAEVSSFSFLTKPQTVLPNTLSKEITVQSLNESSVPEAISETFDLSFSSNSSTGLFLGSTGKPASRTMSKNTSKRTFYYKDSSVGDFVLTVTATGRDSRKTFTFNQNIKIGKVSAPVKVVVSKPTTKDIKEEIGIEEVKATTTEEFKEIFTAKERKGFFHTIFSWPVKVFGFIERFFVEG